MSKVIRIDDETFSRLQGLAEPLIDTPSDVIVRLLNYYESSIRTKNNTNFVGKTVQQSMNSNEIYKEGVPQPMSSSHNLFLAPAIEENIEKTIKSSISLKGIQEFLSKEEFEGLQKKSPDLRLHCWAMTESRRAVFDSMKEGDIVLFTVKNSGKFQFYGEVIFKVDNEKLGNYLWDFVPNKPWRLIYFLKNVRAIDVDKTKLVEALSYDSNYNVPGIINVKRINLEIALNRHGSIKSLIESVQEKF